MIAGGVTAPVFAGLSGNGNIRLSDLSNSAVNLTVGNDDSDMTYAGVLSGPGSLTKVGADTLTLTGVNTFTGPTHVAGGAIRLSDNNHQILNNSLPAGSNGTVMMDLSGDFNLTGIIHDGGTFTGGLDGSGLALSDYYLSGTITSAGGSSFIVGAVGSANVVQATGQDINVTLGQYSQLEIRATAVGGNQASQVFTVNYTDGSSTPFTQGITDWASQSGPVFGKSSVVTMPYANKWDGTKTTGSNYYVYGYTFSVDPTKTVSSITLPDNSHVMVLAVTGVAPDQTPTNLSATPATSSDMHLSWTAPSGYVYGYNVYRGETAGGESATPLNGTILWPYNGETFKDTTVVPGNTYYYSVRAVEASQNYPLSPPSNEASAATPSPGPTTQADLSTALDLTGIMANGATFSGSGGLDGSGHAISSTLLQQANLGFLIGQAGQNDVVKASGQTIALPPGEFTQLQLLATAVGSASTTSQQFTVNYSDGSYDTFTQNMSKWTAPQNYTGESVALPLAQANTSSGGTVNGTYDVYSYTFNLASAKTVSSITLPSNASVIVLGINLQTANLLPTGTALTIDPGAMLDLNGTNQQVGSLAGTGGDILLANSTLTVGNSSNTTFGGTLDGNGVLTKIGSGALTLSGPNDYSGVTTVSGGTLQAGAANSFSPYSAYPNGAGGLNANGFTQVTPSPPVNLVGTAATASEIDLSWTDPVAGNYQVEEQPAGSNTWTVLGTTTATSYAATGLTSSGHYTFRVMAISPFGNSAYVSTPSCSTSSAGTQDFAPAIQSPPYADGGSTVTGTSAVVHVPSATGGAGPYAYSWSATSVPQGAGQPTFVPGTYFNGFANVPDVNVTFSQAGAYTIQALVTDAQGLSTASSLTLTVQQTVSTISVASATVATGGSLKLVAIAKDQFGNTMSPEPSFTWSVTSGSGTGSVDSNGVYTAPSQAASATVRVNADPFLFPNATANVTISEQNASSDVYVQAGDTIDLNEVKVYTHSGAWKEDLPVNGPFPDEEKGTFYFS